MHLLDVGEVGGEVTAEELRQISGEAMPDVGEGFIGEADEPEGGSPNCTILQAVVRPP